MSGNPFTLTFGQKPGEFIPRMKPMKMIRDSFEMEIPTSRVYMLAGIRGSGKTVSLTELSDEYSGRDGWLVVNLSADTDLVGQSYSELLRISRGKNIFAKTDISAEINLPVVDIKVRKADAGLKADSALRSLLEQLGKKGRKVLFLIDEINNNPEVRHFCSEFQIYIRMHYPVYLIMAGLYDNISNLQNVKTLTFLYRVPKIFLAPLNLAAITASYQSVFQIPGKEAVEMAKLTKGYPFAFQILGYLRWENDGNMTALMSEYDSLLAQYAYEKIWSELSEKDQEIVKAVADGCHTVKAVRDRLAVSSQYLNVYRRRLIDRGVLCSPQHGALDFALPRFAEYVQLYWLDE